MKKLWFLVLLIFIPFVFVGCFEKPKPPRDVKGIVLSNFKNLPNYKSTLTYEKNGNQVIETCTHETLLGYKYYYYTCSVNNKITKEYWIDEKVVVQCYKKINDTTTYFTKDTVGIAMLDATSNARLLFPSNYVFSTEKLNDGTLTKNGGIGDYILTIDDYEFDIKNETVKEVKYKDFTVKFEDGKIADANYRSIYTEQDEKDGKILFDEILNKISKLEILAQNFLNENTSVTYSKRYLTLNYLRSGSTYVGSTWNHLLGNIHENFIDYVEENQGTDDLVSLRNMDKTEIYLPYSTHQIDFTHLIAVVSLNERYGASSKMSDLGGFGGDIAQLSIGLKNIDDDLLQDTANNRMGSEDYAFGLKDYMADIDGINIGRDLSKNKVLTVSDALKNYYYKYDISFSTTKALSAINIAPTTIELAKSNLKYRLESNTYISGWLFTNNGTFGKHFTACVNAFVDFVYRCL